ncbi:MAG: CCA tRNA nucleotidyltransferase [Candidatus Poribacteria bacterium]
MPENMRKIAIDIVKKLNGAGYKALFAGGCVRDEIMGIEPDDYDIATDARPDEVMALFEKTAPVGAQFGVVLVVIDNIPFQVATFRSDGRYIDGRHPENVRLSASAEDDALRRDFTINGLMFDPIAGKLYDYVNGKKDIEDRIIRCIGEPRERFSEDKLRLIRAVRFAARFEYQIEKRTFGAIKELAPTILEVSYERIRMELVKIFTGKNAGNGLQLLHDTGLLAYVLPEVSAMVGIPQPRKFHPEGDVFTHTKLTLDNLIEPSPVLAFAALLHDVGKPRTMTITDRIRFHEHNKVGAEMAKNICTRLRFSKDEREKIVACVENHMTFMNIHRMKKSTLKRLFQRETFLDELALHKADCLASHGSLENWEFCKRRFEKYSAEEIKPEPLINGHDLINLGYKPGPMFKEILSAVEEAQLDNQIETKEEALKFVMENF